MKEDDRNILILRRLEQAKTSLDDAQYLLDGNRSPQSILNRCYYAMFYAALALLQNIGKIPSKHSGVISLFDTEFVLKNHFEKDLSRDFHKAFELRHISDYQITERITIDKAADTLKRARKFLLKIEEYLQKELS